MSALSLPFPPSSLSGHAKGHWRDKAAITAKHRDLAKRVTQAAAPKVSTTGDIRIHIRLVPPDRRGDRTNFPNRLKPYLDGIADALGVNDARFVPTYEFAPPEKPGCVDITIEPAAQLPSLDGLTKSQLVRLKNRIEDALANRFAEAA
jgi:crossover junction endodeoxyribonuclease RusA